jgi:Transposase IS66 family
VLRGTSTGYTINEVTLAYWERQQLAEEVVERFRVGPQHFADESTWLARLAELGIEAKLHVRLGTEGALLGQIIEQGVSPKLVILSDGAQQFEILVHASCWVHAERPLTRVVPYHDAHRAAIAQVRQQIWDLYKDLKAYRVRPDPAQKPIVEARFDALVSQQTDYPTSIGQVLKSLRDYKADLLLVLDRPEVPLHNNGTESIIRGYVKTRKISGSTRSELGRRCRDTFASLKKTCRKLGVSFWTFLVDRLGGFNKIPRLATLIHHAATESSSAPLAQAVPA